MLPFKADDTYYIAKTGKADFVFPSHLSKGARNLLSRLMTPNPKKRITISEIYEDEWFKVGFIKETIQKIVLSDDDDSTIILTEPVMDTKEKIEKKPINAFELSSYFLNQENLTNYKGTCFILPGTNEKLTNSIEDILKDMKLKYDKKLDGFRAHDVSDEFIMTFSIDIVPILGDFCLVQARKTRGSAFKFVGTYNTFTQKCQKIK